MVIFDVDQVLIERSCKVFWAKTEKEHEQWLNQLYDKVFNRPKHDPAYYLSIMLKEDTPIVIEPIIIDIIHTLQSRGVTVIALTTTNTGSCFTIPSLPIWRFNKLKEVGIDFSNVTISNMEFPELPSKSPDKSGQHPLFYNGILFTSDAAKGAVLTAFFEHTKLKPSRVIFFDDKRSNLESASQAMHALGIPFEGYEYQGGQYIPGELDKDVAQRQLHYLVDNEKWLSEDEVKEKLNTYF
jgi:FMN phosphatase YigB (HAD superfamily)